MEQILSALNTGWLGSIIGLAGIALSLWFFRKSKREASPTCYTSSTELVGPTYRALPESVTVHYDGALVPRVVKTLVCFWNDGSLTLNGADIATSEPLRVTFSSGKILTARVVKVTRPAIQAAVKIAPENSKEARITFEFLDPMDGIVIECLHTGEPYLEKVEGIFKGVPKGIREGRVGSSYIAWRRRSDTAGKFLFTTVGLIAAATVFPLDSHLRSVLDTFGIQATTESAKGWIIAVALTIYVLAKIIRPMKLAYPKALSLDMD